MVRPQIQKRRHLRLKVAISAALVALTAACGGPGSAQQAEESGSSTINIAYWPGINQLAIIKEKKCLEGLGYNVNWQEFLSFLPAASQAMIAGEIDVTLGNTTQAVSLFAEQPELAWVVGQLTTNDPAIVAREGSGIDSIEDIQGKRVATTGVNTANHAVLLIALAEAGIKPSTVENEYFQTGTTSVISLFKQEAADAAETFVPFSTSIVQQGLGKIIVTGDEAASRPFPSNGLIARQDFAENNPEAVTDLMRCVMGANAFLESNPEESYEIFANFSDIDVETVTAAFESGQPAIADVVPDTADHKAIVEAEVRYGVVDKPGIVDFTGNFVNPKYAEDAVEQGAASIE